MTHRTPPGYDHATPEQQQAYDALVQSMQAALDTACAAAHAEWEALGNCNGWVDVVYTSGKVKTRVRAAVVRATPASVYVVEAPADPAEIIVASREGARGARARQPVRYSLSTGARYGYRSHFSAYELEAVALPDRLLSAACAAAAKHGVWARSVRALAGAADE